MTKIRTSRLPNELLEVVAAQPANVARKVALESTTFYLPDDLLEVVAAQPPNVDRKVGAALISRYIFPVSHRSLEDWPLPTRRVNGRAIIPTLRLFEVAYQKFRNAPVVMSGRPVGPRETV